MSPSPPPLALPDHAPAALVSTRLGPVELASHGDGAPALYLHGAMGGHDQSWLLARTLGRPGDRHLALSRPGYLGTPLRSGYSFEAQADLYASLLDALGLERAVVFAVSGGGPSALHFAARHPDRCRALVLASTPGGPMRARPPWSFALTSQLLRWRWFAAKAQARIARDPDAAAARSIADPELRARTLADPEAGPLLRALLASTLDRAGERLPGTRRDIALTRAATYPLEAITAPTLVIHGTIDPLLPAAEHGAVLAARIPGAERCVADGGEHVAIFTHRAAIRAQVHAFLARAWSPRRPRPARPAATPPERGGANRRVKPARGGRRI